jgi:hypothetical protein
VSAAHRHERLRPDRVEHPHPGRFRVALAQLPDAALEFRRRAPRFRPRSGQVADRPQGAADVVEPARLGDEDRVPQPVQSLVIARAVAALPREDEIGLEQDDALQIHVHRVPHLRQGRRPGRQGGVARHAHQAASRPGGERHLGEAGRYRDDALRGPGQRDGAPGVVGDGNRLRARG